MASSKEYLEFILGQLSDLNEITYRAMMGEFVIYYCGKIVGGIGGFLLGGPPGAAAGSSILGGIGGAIDGNKGTKHTLWIGSKLKG